MKLMHIPFIYGCLFQITFGLQAQEGPTTSGGNALGSGGNIAYSVGQVVYTTTIGTNGSVSQGIQQAFEISVVTELREAKGINLMVSVYPNPATTLLNLAINPSVKVNICSLSYRLYDMNGKLLETKKLEGNQTSIVVNKLVPAIYFLKVIEENKEIKTFKIIKN